MKSHLPILVLFMVFMNAARAHDWTVDSLPDPRISPRACGHWWPWDTSSVCSPDHLVDGQSLSIIQDFIGFVHAGERPWSKLFCPERGHDVPVEVMAVVIDAVDGAGGADTAVADFANGIRERLGVGSTDCGNGAVLVMSVNDNQVWLVCVTQRPCPFFTCDTPLWQGWGLDHE